MYVRIPSSKLQRTRLGLGDIDLTDAVTDNAFLAPAADDVTGYSVNDARAVTIAIDTEVMTMPVALGSTYAGLAEPVNETRLAEAGSPRCESGRPPILDRLLDRKSGRRV